MGIIQWDSKYEVDVKKIGRQHKKIVGILNKLYAQQDTITAKNGVQKILDELRKYILVHFKTEEAYLREIKCDGYDLQKEEHNAFIEKICSFQKDYFQGKQLVLINLFNYVWDWFSHHILTVDKKCMIKARSLR